MNRPTQPELEKQTSDWNSAHPVGTPVTRYKLINPLREGAETKTRSEAWVMGGHSVMVQVEGVSGGVLLESVVPLPLSENPSRDQWFSYSSDAGFDEHATEDEARKSAEEAIQTYRDDAPAEGWSEDIWNVRYGKIQGWAVETTRKIKPPESELDEDGCDSEGTDFSQWDEIAEYGIFREPSIDWKARAEAAEEELAQIRTALSDANAVRLNMLRGTIAYTKETLLHVLGNDSQLMNQCNEENAELRKIFPEILQALGNGSFCNEKSSLDFLKGIPAEVEAMVDGHRGEIAAMRQKLEFYAGGEE